jgi:protein gp37
MGDLFGEWVPAEWIQAVIEVCRECPQHIFMFLTKNPKRYAEFEFPPNCWLGMSVTGSENATPLYVISNLLNKNVKFISWEPIITTILYKHYRNIDWLIMGAMTGPGAKQHQPDPWWIENAVGGCRNNHIPIFMKDSIKPFYEGELIREWPERRA